MDGLVSHVKGSNRVRFNMSKLSLHSVSDIFASKGKMPKETRIVPRGFNFDGREIVCAIKMTERSFSVAEDDKVADYDESVIRNYWNSSVVQKSWKSRFLAKLKHGVLKRTCRILALFILLHYIFSIVMLTSVCLPSSSQNMTSTYAPRNAGFLSPTSRATNNTDFCANYVKNNLPWREKEKNMTRILTFLIGFYVGFIIRNYWQSLRYLPTFDSLCLGMGSFVFVSRSVDESKYGIKIENVWISLKQFKKDIVRLSILSWTMCMCRISRSLKMKFMEPLSFNAKKLLTYQEYEMLMTPSNDDCWLEKWTTPLLWVNKMVRSVGKNIKITDDMGEPIGSTEGVARFDDAKEVGIAISKLKDNLQILSNQYYFKVPDLMLQCISYALYFFMVIGVFAAQGEAFHPNDDRNIAQKLIADFPFYYCVKYSLLIGWLKAAKDLQNPFGEDV